MSFWNKGSNLLTGYSKLTLPLPPFLLSNHFKQHIIHAHAQYPPFPPNFRFGSRLASIKENKKFRRIANEANSKTPSDLKEFISDIRRTFDLK